MSLLCKDFLIVDIFVDFACEIGGEADKDKNSWRENLFFTLVSYRIDFKYQSLYYITEKHKNKEENGKFL